VSTEKPAKSETLMVEHRNQYAYDCKLCALRPWLIVRMNDNYEQSYLNYVRVHLYRVAAANTLWSYRPMASDAAWLWHGFPV